MDILLDKNIQRGSKPMSLLPLFCFAKKSHIYLFRFAKKSLIYLFLFANKSYFYLFLGNLVKFLPKHFLLSFYFRNFGGRNKK